MVYNNGKPYSKWMIWGYHFFWGNTQNAKVIEQYYQAWDNFGCMWLVQQGHGCWSEFKYMWPCSQHKVSIGGLGLDRSCSLWQVKCICFTSIQQQGVVAPGVRKRTYEQRLKALVAFVRCPLHVHIPDDKSRVLLFCLLEASILHGLALHLYWGKSLFLFEQIHGWKYVYRSHSCWHVPTGRNSQYGLDNLGWPSLTQGIQINHTITVDHKAVLVSHPLPGMSLYTRPPCHMWKTCWAPRTVFSKGFKKNSMG